MNIPVHQYGPLIVVCSDALCRAGQGMLDGGLSARMAKASHPVVTKSASCRALSAPVGRPEPGAGRHTVAAAVTKISSRSASGWPSS